MKQKHPVTGNTTSKQAEDLLFNGLMTKERDDEKVRELAQEGEGRVKE